MVVVPINLNSILCLIILFNLFLFNVFRCWEQVLCLGSHLCNFCLIARAAWRSLRLLLLFCGSLSGLRL